MSNQNLSFYCLVATTLIIGGIALAFDIANLPNSDNSLSLINKDGKRLQDWSSYQRLRAEKQKKGIFKNDSPDIIAQIERDRRTSIGESSPTYQANYKFKELEKAKKKIRKNYKSDELNFIERGPANVAGRTRAVLVMPNDLGKNTWLAGSASGGIWKTTDSGQSWENKTPNLPNLGTNTLAHSLSKPEVIYAGTGEHFTDDIDGAGMWKSEDAGESWSQIVSPVDYPDFRNVSRIIVDPNDHNTIIATTRNSVWEDDIRAAIYKSTDGGASWRKTLEGNPGVRYDHIIYNPENFLTQYVAVYGRTVLKSTDGGETWTESGEGLQPIGRIEIAISPVDTARLWASVEGDLSGNGSDLYMSSDAGKTWNLTIEDQGNEFDFLGGQGWYDNTIVAHPFDANTVYVGGVDMWKMTTRPGTRSKTTFEINDGGAFRFLDFINGTVIGGGILQSEEIAQSQFVSVELRFGQGGQKAHRFSVSGRGSGVPDAEYSYVDLVDIPFQAWDITNDRQLMVSFRDQADDGSWDLIERSLNNLPSDSREYIFVHDVTYADTANINIAKDGGQTHRQLYFMWPVLRGGTLLDNQSPSSFSIDKTNLRGRIKQTLNVSDAYGQYSRRNGFSNSQFSNNLGVHPDHHNLIPIITSQLDQTFRLLSANDGGLHFSKSSSDPGIENGDFSYAGFGYNTTQFYGADKAPGKDRYIGGMQDNSTWYTPFGRTSDGPESYFEFAFGGDGFEAIWNNRDDRLLLGTIQFNNIQRSSNGGRTWQSATSGITDRGPFISRLSNSRVRPDDVYTLGSSGVWKSSDFGLSWNRTTISDKWSFNFAADIEVSLSNPDVIWAGGELSENRRLQVSTDAATTFAPVSNYEEYELGRVSGIGTHPTLDSTGYALFSFAGKPKVLRSDDLGQTWKDISGFADSENGESTRGFPNVATNCILIFPNDTSRIWVGTEIGIVESLDAGQSWNLLSSNLQFVNVYDFKIQDDQIILATYGRGIWTVEIEGIGREYIFPPTITDVTVNPKGDINVVATISNNFDSTDVVIIEGVAASTSAQRVGEINYNILDLQIPEGIYEIVVTGYRDSEPYTSAPYEAYIFTPNQPQKEYFNNLDIISGPEDIAGSNFGVSTESGFSNAAIHTAHPYSNMQERSVILKTPWIVADSQYFEYRDVAIIETGEPGSRFGTVDFYDYVVVEGSLDGKRWVPLEDGYDASLHADWERAYDQSGFGTESLYKDHRIDLKNAFSIDDTILIRFRLFADPFTTGWGWAVDNLDLRIEKTTPVVEIGTQSLVVYPNPVQGNLYIDIPSTSDDIDITIHNLNGQQVYHHSVKQAGGTWDIDVSLFTPGLYMMTIREGTEVGVTKIVVE